ncbi:MAG: hypothetical protein RJA41_981, partial [Actinomycetota bacterium]
PTPKASPPPKLSDVAPATKPAAKKEAKAEVVADKPVHEAQEEQVAKLTEEPAPTRNGDVSLESLKGLWTTVLNTLRDMEGGGRVAWSVAVAGFPTAVAGDLVTISFGNVGPIDIAKKRGVDKLLVKAIELVFNSKVTVALEHVEGFTAPEPKTSAPDISPKPVAKAQPANVDTSDTPDEEVASDDDPVLDLATGTELVQKMFGGKVIDEYDEKKKR